MKRVLAACFAALGAYVLIACASSGSGSGNGGCGNNTKDGTEACDGKDFGGLTCQTLGFKGGNLGCNATTCQLDPATCCNDSCVNVGDTQCQGSILQTCSQGATGCRGWVQSADCASNGQLCDATGGKAACAASCVSACPTLGATQCNAGVIEKCETNATTTCNQWTPGEDCAAKSQSCDATSGTAQCGAACVNQCTKAGDTQCSGNVLRTCTQGADGCLMLLTTSDCAAAGQACTTPGGVAQCTLACNNKCSAVGTQNCVGNVLSTCGSDANGCLDWQQTEDCSLKSQFCKLAGAGKAKCEGVCTNPCPTLNAKQCNANVIQECKVGINGCQDWQATTTCPLGQKCEQSGSNYSCVTGAATGEDCGTVIPIKAGKNTLNWTATKNDYLVSTPSCASGYSVLAPDLVLAYQAGFTGSLEFTFEKPISTRWVAVVGSGTCGSVSAPLACVADYSLTAMSGSVNVTSGTTYFFYVAHVNSGTAPLNNPLVVTLAEVNCSTFSASAVTQTPAHNSTTSTLKPTLTVDFDVPLVTTGWTVKVTGNKGTNLSFTYPNTAITWTNGNKTLNINPGIAMPAGEVVTVDLSGFTDAKCSKPITKPSWQFTVVTPPCSIGQNGMVGAAVTKVSAPSGLWYYVATDTSPTGYVYLGNTSTLWRVTKGSWIQQTAAGVTSSWLGYGFFMNGPDPFSIRYTLTGTAGYVWKLIPGTTWSGQDYVTFPQVPGDYLRSGVVYKGKIYMITTESTTGTATEVWSANAAPSTFPNNATQEATFTGENYCSGLAVDDKFFYTACGTNKRLIRIDRTTKAVTLITNAFDLNTSSYSNAVHAQDTNNDGTADFLYYKGYRSEVYFVCSPAGTTPYADILASYGTSTSSYGLGFDATNKTLYAFDYGAYQLAEIK
ncbi:MAG: hypothetical protein IPI67_29545 [Myxococcales bacterium]|nr:hypothetical protein [Myxococcales bacterium]